MFDFVFFIGVTIIDLIGAAIIAAGFLSAKWRLFPAWHKAGLAFAMIGLVCQAGRNIQFLVTSVSSTDADLPLWVLKDLGIATVAIGFAYVAYQARKAQQAAPVKKRVVAKKTPARRR